LAQQTKEDYIQKKCKQIEFTKTTKCKQKPVLLQPAAQNKSMHSNPETQPTKALSSESNSDPDLKVCHASM